MTGLLCTDRAVVFFTYICILPLLKNNTALRQTLFFFFNHLLNQCDVAAQTTVMLGTPPLGVVLVIVLSALKTNLTACLYIF